MPGAAACDNRGGMLDSAQYHARRRLRRERARAAAVDPSRAAAALGAWRFVDRLDPGPLLEGWTPAAGPDADRLVAWMEADDAPLDPGPAEAALDLVRLDRLAAVPPPAASAEDRRAAAVYLLARLGEEIARREVEEPRLPVPRDRRDPEALDLWTRMLGGSIDLTLPRRLREAWGGAVRRSFRAVCDGLRLPASQADYHVEQALDAMEFLPFGAHLDLALRVVEGADEPLSALAALLDPAGAAVAARCVGRREGWLETALALLPGAADEVGLAAQLPEAVSVGADLHVFRRLLLNLGEAPFAVGGAHLPGWRVVANNRGKIRGRLRAVVAAHPGRLLARLRGLEALHRRTDDAVGRWAWDWAWREARAGFTFDVDHLRYASCVVPPAPEPADELPEGLEPVVLTWLLLTVGRGVYDEVRPWAEEVGTEQLSAKLYRYLKAAPEVLADPRPADGEGAGRNRTYHRLRRHLRAQLDIYEIDLLEVAMRVAAVPAVRKRGELLRQVLDPPWMSGLVEPPKAFVDDFVEAFQVFLTRRRPPSGVGGES